MQDLSTTLVAIATGAGPAGVGCVRLSGPGAYAIACRLLRSARPLTMPREGRPRFVTVLDAGGAPIDHGYAVGFPPERSYTGEPAVELWVHGSPPVLAALVAAAIAHGASAAGPGEFTYRALRNGRLDLGRAEAVRDLVGARTLHQARVAFAQVEGALSRRLAPLRDLLIDLIARGEASVEFVEESEVHLGAGRLRSGVDEALALARGLLREGRSGQLLRDGARVAITGVTGVGKSSLFNRLLGRERAIVSADPGTTRDTLEETVDRAGIPVTLIDTAGLRETRSAVEAEGVRRARAAAREAELSVVVLDASRALLPEEADALAGAPVEGGPRSIIVANKVDRLPPGLALPWPAIPVSAATGAGVPDLTRAIVSALSGGTLVESPAMTSARHAAAMEAAVVSLEAAGRAQASGLSEEAALEDLREALGHVGEITGEVATDDLYDRIFSTFCIGK